MCIQDRIVSKLHGENLRNFYPPWGVTHSAAVRYTIDNIP